MRLYKFEGSRFKDGKPFQIGNYAFAGIRTYRPNELCKEFLGLKPRPTMIELTKALFPLDWNPREHKGFVENPDKPGYLKYDPQAYEELLEHESQRRREYMKQVIQSRANPKDANPSA
jgi:hypothetical protein